MTTTVFAMDSHHSPFQTLPMLIVHKVVEYLEGHRKNSFTLDIDEHNKKKAVLVPLLMLAPMATKVVAKFIYINSSEPNYMQLYSALVSELYQGQVDRIQVNSGVSSTLALALRSVSGLTSIVQGPNVSCSSFAQLAYCSASTLRVLSTQIGQMECWHSFIYGGTTVPTTYSALTDLSLVVTDFSYQSSWTATEDIVPFPVLTTLTVDGGYPFSDDLLFRGNGSTLQYLHLPFSAIAQNGLGRFGVLKRNGVAKMSSISISGISDLDKAFLTEHPEAPVKLQVHQMLEVAAKLKFATDTPGVLIFESIRAAPNTAILRYLEFGELWCSADDIIKLLVTLPRLAYLSCGIRELQAEILAIPVSERPSRLRQK
ncbi:hypothetical protein LPJ60_005015 [Coemansia sp. RSA 2675]|nr:hypothetical protein LPJ60_005015 [Coemansia sp. RSA 2675]